MCFAPLNLPALFKPDPTIFDRSQVRKVNSGNSQKEILGHKKDKSMHCTLVFLKMLGKISKWWGGLMVIYHGTKHLKSP